jgi:hypothetical protein
MNLNDWEIPKALVDRPWPALSEYTQLWEFPSLDSAIVAYEVEEASMCAYYGRLAVLKNKASPSIIAAPSNGRVFLTSAINGVLPASTIIGELAVINGGFYHRKDVEDSENPIFFLNISTLEVVAVRMRAGWLYWVDVSHEGKAHFCFQRHMSGRQEYDEHLKSEFVVNLADLDRTPFSVLDAERPFFDRWYYSLPPVHDWKN